jgi:hypothetical protein
MANRPKPPRTDSPTEIEQWRLAIVGPGGYILKVIGAVAGNIAEFIAGGSLKDSGLAVTKVKRTFAYRTITSATYNVDPADGTIFIDATSNNIDISHVSAVGFGGEEFDFVRIDNSDNTVKLIADGAEKISTDSEQIIYGLESMTTKSDNANWWVR